MVSLIILAIDINWLSYNLYKWNKLCKYFLTTTFSLVTSRRIFSSVSCKFIVFLMRLMSVTSVMSVVRSVRSLMLLIFVMSVMSSIMMVSCGVSTIFSTKSVCERSLTIFHVFVLASNIYRMRPKQKAILFIHSNKQLVEKERLQRFE